MALPLSVEILGKIYVIMNVLWSVVQSLCSCVQIERLGFCFTRFLVFCDLIRFAKGSAFITVARKNKKREHLQGNQQRN